MRRAAVVKTVLQIAQVHTVTHSLIVNQVVIVMCSWTSLYDVMC